MDDTQVKAKGQELDNREWKLPKRFQLQAELLALPPEELKKRDPEMYRLWQQTQEQQQQWKRQANEPFSQPSVQDIFRAQAVQMAEEMRTVIERLKAELSKTITSGGDEDPRKLQDAIRALRFRRAESLALIGRYDLAASETPDAERRDHYHKIIDALNRPDDEWCKCEPHRGTGPYSELEMSRQYVRSEVFSIVHGQVVFLLACTGCGEWNGVRELPKHIAEARGHRARAHQMASTLTPDDAAKLLASRNHTTKGLLK